MCLEAQHYKLNTTNSKIKNMFIQDKIEEYNHKNRAEHQFRFEYTAELLSRKGINVQAIIEKIKAFQIAIPRDRKSVV